MSKVRSYKERLSKLTKEEVIELVTTAFKEAGVQVENVPGCFGLDPKVLFQNVESINPIEEVASFTSKLVVDTKKTVEQPYFRANNQKLNYQKLNFSKGAFLLNPIFSPDAA